MNSNSNVAHSLFSAMQTFGIDLKEPYDLELHTRDERLDRLNMVPGQTSLPNQSNSMSASMTMSKSLKSFPTAIIEASSAEELEMKGNLSEQKDISGLDIPVLKDLAGLPSMNQTSRDRLEPSSRALDEFMEGKRDTTKVSEDRPSPKFSDNLLDMKDNQLVPVEEEPYMSTQEKALSSKELQRVATRSKQSSLERNSTEKDESSPPPFDEIFTA